MKLLNLILIFFLSTTSSHAFLSGLFGGTKCSKLEWTKENGRTQGGGWIWYPGKGRGLSLEDATLLAEGRALEMLVKECLVPHKEVKVHERCHEQQGNEHVVFLRLSLEDTQCRQAKTSNAKFRHKIKNRELERTLTRYRKKIGDSEKVKKECSALTGRECFQMGKQEYFLENLKDAKKLFTTGCNKNHRDSCFNGGVVLMRENQFSKSQRYFEKAKKLGDTQSLFFLGHIGIQNGDKSKAVKHYSEACDKRISLGCLALASFYWDESKLHLASKYFELACDYEEARSCHQASVFFWDIGNDTRSMVMARRACKLNSAKSCFNYGMNLRKKKKTVKAFKNLSKACRLGVTKGCLIGAELNKNEKIKLLKSGCEQGDGEACKKASIYFYDRKKTSESTMYSIFACKLGVSKSCHNSGLLQYQKGRIEKAKNYLTLACKDGIEQSCSLLKEID